MRIEGKTSFHEASVGNAALLQSPRQELVQHPLDNGCSCLAGRSRGKGMVHFLASPPLAQTSCPQPLTAPSAQKPSLFPIALAQMSSGCLGKDTHKVCISIYYSMDHGHHELWTTTFGHGCICVMQGADCMQ